MKASLNLLIQSGNAAGRDEGLNRTLSRIHTVRREDFNAKS
jgi:hypothetical protein